MELPAVYPRSLNLHPNRYEVEDQGQTLQCGRFATAEALDTAAQRAGAERGYSPSFLRWATDENRGLPPGDHSARLDEVADALQRYGICKNAEFNGHLNWSLQPGLTAKLKAQLELPISMRPVIYRNDDVLETVKWYLGQGMVVLASMMVPIGWSQAVQYKGWKTHVLPTAFGSSEHVIPIIGYDDDAQRFLFKNSFGPLWGDAGYGGLEYKNIAQGPDRCVYQLYVIDKCKYPLVKAEGFMPGTATLTPAEISAYRAQKKAEWTNAIAATMPNGITLQGVIDGAVSLNLKDRNVEICFEMQRGALRPFLQANGLTAPESFFEPL